jgi:hypothetical protein
MQKVLISIPDDLATRLRIAIPMRQRSKIITFLIKQEIERREHDLYACALEVEKDNALNDEMREWDVTIADGLSDEVKNESR